MTGHRAFAPDGFRAEWVRGEHSEHLTLSWENEAWTAVGVVEAERVEYVMRLTAQWNVSQFLLFRDLDEPDLWLGTDGHGRWGEVNGAHRPDLDGTGDIAVPGSPFSHAIPIRRLPLLVGHAAELHVIDVDVETLGVVPAIARYERIGDRRWRHERSGSGVEFDVDEFGLPIDVGDAVRRIG